jgi:hypothetical protein
LEPRPEETEHGITTRPFLNGFPFGDIATKLGSDIFIRLSKGWVNGTAPGVFSPDAPLTRAQAAAVLVRALGYPWNYAEYGFNDTSDSWAADYISTARRYGLSPESRQ